MQLHLIARCMVKGGSFRSSGLQNSLISTSGKEVEEVGQTWVSSYFPCFPHLGVMQSLEEPRNCSTNAYNLILQPLSMFWERLWSHYNQHKLCIQWKGSADLSAYSFYIICSLFYKCNSCPSLHKCQSGECFYQVEIAQLSSAALLFFSVSVINLKISYIIGQLKAVIWLHSWSCNTFKLQYSTVLI